MDFVANFICFVAVQKFWKSVKIWQSYRQFKGGNFFETQCMHVFVWVWLCVWRLDFHLRMIVQRRSFHAWILTPMRSFLFSIPVSSADVFIICSWNCHSSGMDPWPCIASRSHGCAYLVEVYPVPTHQITSKSEKLFVEGSMDGWTHSTSSVSLLGHHLAMT